MYPEDQKRQPHGIRECLAPLSLVSIASIEHWIDVP